MHMTGITDRIITVIIVIKYFLFSIELSTSTATFAKSAAMLSKYVIHPVFYNK